MTPEYILRKSLCRPAHCYSAHVPGKGYVNNGQLESERADYDRQRQQTAESEIENLGYASDYAEPGYTAGPRGILLANWNVFPRGIDSILERAGYSIEWSDAWSACDDCGKLVRTSPDSYSWTPSYTLLNDCELVCADCLTNNSGNVESMLEELAGNADRCLTADLHRSICLEDFGYRRFGDEEYESGWHPGQTDNPREIAAQLEKQGITDYIFVQTEQSQFYIKFAVYVRTEEQDNADNA